MKLILCTECQDVVKMSVVNWRTCMCGKSAGRYLEDEDSAEIYGSAIAIGMLNSSIVSAIHNRFYYRIAPELANIKAFVFDSDYHKIKVVEKM